MSPRLSRLLVPTFMVLFSASTEVLAQNPNTPPKPVENPYPYSANEPVAKNFSIAKSVEYLDGVAQFWMKPNSCGACHANFAYVMARPVVDGPRIPLLAETRRFLENREPNRVTGFPSEPEMVADAFALAWDDARTGELRPTTRQALGRMWTYQRGIGDWKKMGCGDHMPAENDRRYLAVLGALATGIAPGEYAKTVEARDGLTKLRRYFMQNPPRNVHDEMLLLWASLHVDGLMTTAEREATVRKLIAKQRSDGGWCFAMLTGEVTPTSTTPSPPSDGYGTAFAVYILRRAGVSVNRPEIASGVRWLRTNQRVSGRWFTPTHTAGEQTEGGVGARDLYIQNLGTAFGVLALKECENERAIL